MDHLQKFTAQVRTQLFLLLLLQSGLIITSWWIADHYLFHNSLLVFGTISGVAIASLLILTTLNTKRLIEPVRLIWQAVLHIAPNTANTPAPDLKNIGLGHELVTALVTNVYQVAQVIEGVDKTSKSQQHKVQLAASFIANNLQLPLVVLDKDMNVVFANDAFLSYIDQAKNDVIGQNIYSVLDLLFSNQHTLDSWLNHVRESRVTAAHTWERVRLNLPEQKDTKFFDLIAYYSNSNPEGFEIMLTLFDRTRQYSQDEQAMSFLALAVHELRTPLTLLRGYIDVFEEELEGKLDPELTNYIHKMKATAQQLASFIGNVLNVSRFENDQLLLNLHEEQWAPLLQTAVNDVKLRAQVRGVSLDLKVDDNLPTVGVDAASIYEVVNNLLDNAIKYSKENGQIIIHTHLTNNGLVETTVQDFGVGIPESAMGNLFDKFYRDYRNRTQVGGTGMGLYLSKAIVTAHGGNIWVRSKEGAGSTFGFTLIPYAKLGDEKKGDHADIVRTAHGWIKNHSLYRR